MSGFQISKDLGNGGYAGALLRAYVPATNTEVIARGDIVKPTGSGDANGVPGVNRAAAAGTIYGVVTSIEVEGEENLNKTWLPADTAGYVNIQGLPDVAFEVECTAQLSAADIGLNADATFTSSSVSGGIATSGMKLDSSTKAATASLQFRIVALLPDEDGVVGNRALVRINNGSFTNTTGA